MTCLVVDDSATTRRICRRALEALGCGVLEAGSRAEAEPLAATELELVIVGRQLPDADVLDVVRALRANDTNARVPILMISDAGQRAAVTAASEAGVTSYLLRPFELPLLQQRIQALLRAPEGEEDGAASAGDAPGARAA